ncbi:MAG: SDR family oxidoreductase [Clostridiales bacterium]|nr:SDR family oxidoreductase [Clostridiales bacterium]MDD6873033.1 SDR family oxidoreductase [Clostridiales bacterium]MDY2873382.1 SDR family oxidoreductase [Eubacteriales bacterium]
MRFENRTAIITGAASGMGLCASQEMAKEGAIVYMVDVNEARVTELAQEIVSAGGHAVPCPCDVRDFDQIQAVVNKCLTDEGHVDIVINFAGGFPARMCGCKDGAFIHTPLDVLDWGIAVNFRAPMLFARAVMEPMMNQKKGVIINIGSVDGETGGAVDYAAEKSGLTYGLTKALARIGAPYGVRCCAVSPGPVLTRAAMSNMKTALGRAAEPIEIVKLVMYLCSDDAAFITGTNYNIEGGRVLLNNA